MIETDIAVVGGGPAGLAAAVAARKSGASVLLLDCFANAGGQYYMQPIAGESVTAQAAEGQAAIAAALAGGVRILAGYEVFAAYRGFRLLATGPDGAAAISARRVIAATGAHDRVMGFPGWTLAGVMTAGAGQRLAKINGVLPGRRVVVAGSGVFLWAVAKSLLEKGADVVALIEARRPGLALATHLAAFPERWREALGLADFVRRRAGRIVFGRVVTEARGDDRLTSITIAPTTGGPSETIHGLDALLISHGFQPNIEITSLLDCEHRFDEALGGWHAVVDSRGRSSIEGLYAAGEVTGVAGARPAALAGEIAGLSAAADLGFKLSSDGETIGRLQLQLARARRFGQGLGRLFAPGPELAGFARDETVLCRCEEVTKAEILAACRQGADSLHAVKTWTRAGMGRCQGRMCRMSVTACVAQVTKRPAETLGFNRPRLPSRPVAIETVLAALEDGEPSNER